MLTADHRRVSVIIPVHNGDRFVAESVRSVLEQTRPVLECVVVDDGSTDGTMDVLSSFEPDIRVIRTPPSGVAAARNAGMDAARGDVFAFLDADDVWMPHKIERQLSVMAAAGRHTAIYSGYVISNESLRPRRIVVHEAAPRSVLGALLTASPGIGFSFTGVTTRLAAERVGRFDERLSTAADLDYTWRLSRKCRVIGIQEPLAIYRQHRAMQMHRDVDRLERDMRLLLDQAEAAGLAAESVQRGRTNLDTYLAGRLMLDGAVISSLTHLVAAARPDPRRPVMAAGAAALRRARQHAAVISLAARARRGDCTAMGAGGRSARAPEAPAETPAAA